MQYRRTQIKGGHYFFTVNLANRESDLLVEKIDDLRAAFADIKKRHPFSIVAMSVMPEHLHTLWRLPVSDDNYPMRWSLIKAGFSRRQECGESIRKSRRLKRERGIWQRRYWEHFIRDEADLVKHMDYIHYNPVKHGWVKQAAEWPYSTLLHYIECGVLPADWGGTSMESEGFGER